jgi:hypothetical protein
MWCTKLARHGVRKSDAPNEAARRLIMVRKHGFKMQEIVKSIGTALAN